MLLEIALNAGSVVLEGAGVATGRRLAVPSAWIRSVRLYIAVVCK